MRAGLKCPPLQNKVWGAVAGPCLLYWMLRQQMPEKKSLFPNGKNPSTIGNLIGGAGPESQFTSVTTALLVSRCTLPRWDASTGWKFLFFHAFLCSDDLMGFLCQREYMAGWQLSRHLGEGKCLTFTNLEKSDLFIQFSNCLYVGFNIFGTKSLFTLIAVRQ